ncbi:MAG: isocitrate/isopropylmalate dehydrogenase family protein, partial [Roseiflexaceae bacterium]|nr:isocitrate/isopropylmalate dehydrogenase family protein [Roseiflexaceae bacterium]
MTAHMPFRIVVIPGDGIGPEVTAAAVAVLRATGLPLEFTEAAAGWGTFQRTGAALPEATLQAARGADAILFGAVGSPSQPVPGYKSPIVGLRRALDLYANIRPVEGLGVRDQGLASNTHQLLQPNPQNRTLNLVIVRENTEGLYAGRERVEDGGETAIAERVITRRASERIVRAAFELARTRAEQGLGAGGWVTRSDTPAASPQPPAPRVTLVHKANVLRETCGLFRRVGLEVAAEYPDVQCDELLVDTAALQLVQWPERFDVVVTTNLFGDILSDIACYWGGGMGMATSANLGERHALFEPVHGAAPDIAGRSVANPLAAIGCAAMLLEYLEVSSYDPIARRFSAGNKIRA